MNNCDAGEINTELHTENTDHADADLEALDLQTKEQTTLQHVELVVEDSDVSNFLPSFDIDCLEFGLAPKTALKRITNLKTQILVQNGLTRGRSESPRRRTHDCPRRVDPRPIFRSRSAAEIQCSREFYNREMGGLVSASEISSVDRPFCNDPVDRIGEFESLLSDL